jgi:serine phosphatase RsbU (regulator of sigma subunit)
MAAGRWSEAARNYRLLDKQMALYNMDLSMDNLQQYLIPKFRANTRAGLRDSAVSVAVQITDALDKAIDDQKKNDAAELATIYDTQQKEAQIAQQKAEMSNQRLVGTAIALILVVTFFIVYTLNKRKAQLHLAAAHEKLEDAHARLKTAYDQLETTTKAKERIESELRIASDIQQTMLPSVFPNQQGLDLYGSMTPAKEVGGDLYDYLLTDTDHLYFCLGDVSGKSVPAALFMAQAIRMFRALAKQGLMPADIATRLNDELTIGNENGMFVTMFIGLVDLQTGHLDYCNAGHNPPVVGHHFLEMESNAPIGLWEGLQFVGEALPNVKDTLIFVYSDGLNEAENRQLEQFGEERLLNLLNSRTFDSARQVIDTFNAAVEAHRDGADRNDDLTMLCLMVR